MGKYLVRKIEKDEYPLWDSFVEESTYGHVFNKTFWTESLSKTNQKIKTLIVGCYKNNQLVGGINVCYKKKWNKLSIVMMPPSTPYNHVIVQEKETKYISKNTKFNFEITQLILQYLENEFKYILLNYPKEITDIRALTWNNYTPKVLYTYFTALDDIESLYNQFDHSIRKRIKRGEKLNYDLEIGNGASEIKIFLELENLTYNRQQQKKTISDTHLINFMNLIRDKIEYMVYIIKYDNNPVAARIEIIDNDIVFDWKAGADPKYFDTGLNQVIIWEVIKDMRKKGMKYFDFGGANTPTIADYKSKFNFKLTPYYSVDKIIGFVPKILFKIKEIIA